MADNSGNFPPTNPDSITPENRFTVLMNFAAEPENDEVWERAFDMVRIDGAVPEGEEYTDLARMPADSLIDLAKRIRAVPLSERYAILTEPVSPDRVAFDAFPTFTSPQIQRAMAARLEELRTQGWTFGRALEIGTGTGNSIHVLEPVAAEVVGIDRNEALLNIARARNRSPTTSLQVADALHLPFNPGSFDLIATTGLLASMSRDSETAFWQQIGRMLAPGQVYIDGWWTENEGYPGREMLRTAMSSKAMVADMVVDTAAGNRAVDNNRLTDNQRRVLLARLGMKEYTQDIPDPVANDGTLTQVRIVMKQPPAH